MGFDEPVLEEKQPDNNPELPDKRSPFGIAEKEPTVKNQNGKVGKAAKNSVKSAETKAPPEKEKPLLLPKIIKAPVNNASRPESTIVLSTPKKVELPIKNEVKDTVVKVVNKPQTRQYLTPKYRNFNNQDGLFILFLAIGAIFGWINIFHRKRFTQVLSAFFVTRIINQLVREENSLLQRVFVMVSVIFILVISVFVFQSAVFFNLVPKVGGHVLLFTFCALGVSIVYFSKFFILSFVSYLFDAEKITKDYFYNVFLINNFVGVLMLPLILLIAYGRFIPNYILIYIGVGLFMISFLYRIGRGVIIGLSGGQYSIFHILLYLCTLEILPMILLIKIINQSIKF